MTFHISQALLIERTMAISATILAFGLITIGGLWLLRRAISRSSQEIRDVREVQINLGPAFEKYVQQELAQLERAQRERSKTG